MKESRGRERDGWTERESWKERERWIDELEKVRE